MAINSIIAKVVDPSIVKDGFRRIKLLWLGRTAIREVIHAKELGTDTNPQPNTKMLLFKTLNPKEDVVGMSVDNRNTREDLQPGEKSFFSYDEKGNPLFIITIRGDKMEVGTAPNGTPPANFVVRFNEMEAAFNQLKSDQDAILNLLQTWTVVVNDGGGALQIAANLLSSSSADLSDAKSEELTLN